MYSGLLGVLLLLACRGSSDDRLEPVFDDTELATWTVAPEPLVTLGGLDERDGYYFDGIRGAVATSDYLVVADGGAREVRFYDMRGDLVARSGRVGAGPGEFQTIRGLSLVGDTAVAVWDPQLSRVTVLTESGQFLRTATPDLAAARSPIPRFIGSTPNGTLVFRDGMPDSELRATASGERRDSVQILTHGADGVQARLWTLGSEMWLLNEGTSWGTSPVIFGRAAFQTIAGHLLVLASSDSLELMSYTSDLTREVRRTLPWRTRSIPESQVEAARQALIAEAEKEAAQRSASGMMLNGRPLGELFLESSLRRIASLPARATEPALADLRGDIQGDVWVAQFVQPGTPERWWLVLDSTLTPIARLSAAADLTILDVSRRGLVVVSADGLGREQVAFYPIEGARQEIRFGGAVSLTQPAALQLTR